MGAKGKPGTGEADPPVPPVATKAPVERSDAVSSFILPQDGNKVGRGGNVFLLTLFVALSRSLRQGPRPQQLCPTGPLTFVVGNFEVHNEPLCSPCHI